MGGTRGKRETFWKRSPSSPSSSPITLAKTFYSGPWDCIAAPRAAIPLRSPGVVVGLHGGRAYAPAVSSCPCRRVHRVPARQRKALSGRLRATDSERARGGGSRTRAAPFRIVSSWRWQSPRQSSGFRSVTGNSPAQRTVWTNPALWSVTNQENFCFCGQSPVDGAGILGEGRKAGVGKFPQSGGKRPMGWFRGRRGQR